MFIYTNLKYIREKKKLSQNQFADLIGCNVSNISRWESSKNGMSLDTAYLISEKLNIPLPDLIGKDLRYEEEVVLDKDHVLSNVIFDKTKDLSEEDKQTIINIIDAYKK